ncbi:MAG: ribonuclease R [Gammaproteobacteria bacterium]|nr:MAG: ribonuclease R [Gammaproteobacteria bacterium]
MAKWSPRHDPNAKTEAEKYDNPVPSREFIAELLEDRGLPMTHRQICAEFGVVEPDAIEAIRRRLRAMERDGQLMRNRRDAYGVVDKMDLITGVIIGHRDGFGFLKPDNGGEDFFLGPRQMRSGFDGDRVLARQSGVDHRGRKEATVVEVLERKTQQLVGRYFKESGIGFVAPENKRISQDILIPADQSGDARHGQFVVVDIIEYPTYRSQAKGAVVEVLGDHMAPGMEIDVAIRTHDIPHEWPQAVLQQAQQFGDAVKEDDKTRRIDLRDTPLVTIDGEDAKDFDDAVYAERKKSGGWRLLVAIADVSHYVHPDDALDQEAQIRGNSVYFPEFVVPMLPETLSNGLCSLNPDVDRLAMVCEMSVSAAGKVSRYQFYEAVIRSHARLTYTKVGAIIDEPESDIALATLQEHAAVVPHLYDLYDLYLALKSQRQKRGAIDFETTETRILFGEDRKIEQIVPTVRNDAHRMIEECMLCANVAAARLLQKNKLPALYRVHEGPKEQKLERLRIFLAELGIEFQRKGNPKPADYQQVMQQIEGRPDAELIQTVLLRSMNQAVYTPENKGHFGLAYTAYAHFTSPIRRYPDLLVHRAIRYLIRSRNESTNVKRVPGAKRLSKAKWLPYDAAAMLALGEQCSMTERRADEATWDVVGWLKCEYMQDKVGEEFAGTITGVTNFGLFVELNSVYVEGLIHVSALNSDYYHFDDVRHRLKGERTGILFALGDQVIVRVAKVDLEDRKIDFDLVEGGRRQRWSKNELKDVRKTKKRKDSKPGKRGGAKKESKGAAGKKHSGKNKAGKTKAGKSKAKKGGKKSRRK